MSSCTSWKNSRIPVLEKKLFVCFSELPGKQRFSSSKLAVRIKISCHQIIQRNKLMHHKLTYRRDIEPHIFDSLDPSRMWWNQWIWQSDIFALTCRCRRSPKRPQMNWCDRTHYHNRHIHLWFDRYCQSTYNRTAIRSEKKKWLEKNINRIMWSRNVRTVRAYQSEQKCNECN